ncbi:MAG: prolyl oligopeptidase family serine peptidase [Candidatus Latescibacterota bacterium]|nr:MAG: prolyl oligopeptidase family serine peptidase [Candidatus Latescibacterota bacterium]
MNLGRPIRIGAALLPLVVGSAAATPRLDVEEWHINLKPAVFAQDESPLALRSYPPDTLAVGSRPELPVVYVPAVPEIDARIDDWPVVRWRDLRGQRTLVRGVWSGPDDAAVRFALLWTRAGLVLGASVEDDSLQVARTGALDERVDSILLYVGSSSPGVQRYWRAAERSVRVWSDGRVQAWTRLRNRTPVLFDPRSLGVQAATVVRRQAGSTGGGVDFELFIPWDLFFPALPHDQAGLLVNVLFEDVDGDAEKLLSWATRPRQGALQQTWARLECRPGPPDGTWLVSLASRHVEPGHPAEWSLMRWGGNAAATLEVRGQGAQSWEALETTLPAAPVIVRLWNLRPAQLPWSRARRLEVELGAHGGKAWRTETLYLAPSLDALADSGLVSAAAASAESRFPTPEDISVRLWKVAAVVRDLKPWYQVRYHHLGILVSRAATWAAVERSLADVELLQDYMQNTDSTDVRQRVAARWPQRAAEGYPLGQAFVRGYRSQLDDSVQPYALYVSRTAAAGEAAPLLVVLRAYGESEMTPFEKTSLAQQVEARGWIALSPYGRGDTGFQLAGERDVLEALDHVRSQFAVDDTRIYLTGYSMGGTGAWMLSLRHADLFAATAVFSGYADMDQAGLYEALAYHPSELFFYETQNPARLVRPELGAAYRIVHAGHDPYVSVVHARIMDDRMNEYGVEHELVIPETELHGSELFELELETTLDWLASKQREAPGQMDTAWFEGSGGPVATVFQRGAFAVVPGTIALPDGTTPIRPENRKGQPLTGPEADARAADQFAQEWNALFFGWPRIVPDSAVTPTLRDTKNLVAVGDPRSNQLLAAVAPELPVHYSGDRFEVEGRSWSFADAGILYAVANPLAPDRTLVVLSGMPERLGGFTKSLLKLGADYVVTNDRHEIVAIGHFRGFGSVRPRSQEPRRDGSR